MLAGAALVVVGGAAVAGGAAALGAAGAAGAGGGALFMRRHKQKKAAKKHEKMLEAMQSYYKEKSRSTVTDPDQFIAWPRTDAAETAALPPQVSFSLNWTKKPKKEKRTKVAGAIVDCDAEKDVHLHLSAYSAAGYHLQDFTAVSASQQMDLVHQGQAVGDMVVNVVEDTFGAPSQSLSLDLGGLPDECATVVVACVFATGQASDYAARMTLYEGDACEQFNKVFTYELTEEEVGQQANAYVMGTITRAPCHLTGSKESDWTFEGVRRPLTYASRSKDLAYHLDEHGCRSLLVYPATTFLQIDGADLYDNVHTTWFGFDRLGFLRCAVSTSEQGFEGSNTKVQLKQIFADEHLARVLVVARQPEADTFKYQVKVRLDSAAVMPQIEPRHLMIMGNETWLKYPMVALPARCQMLFEVTRLPPHPIVPAPMLSPAWRIQPARHIVNEKTACNELMELAAISPCSTVCITVGEVQGYTVKESHGLMSAYLQLNFDQQKFKTATDDNTPTPTWTDTVVFKINAGWVNDPMVVLGLYSDKSQLLAEAAFDLSQMPLPFAGTIPMFNGSDKKCDLKMSLNVLPVAPSETQAVMLADGNEIIEDYTE